MSATSEQQLLTAAQGNDESAFQRLIEPYRGELHAHCYRMLGSLHDADDALQDAYLRAWRALGRFEGRSSLRSWLYRIATNTCLDVINRRPKRVLPIDYGPATDPHDGPGTPVVESVWVEPYPDERMGVEDGFYAPEARYEMRESIELAFVAALQHLPANQRAVLILREVLGFSAQEVADALDTSIASVNSALQRARKTVDEKLPDRTQQTTLRELGDEELAELVTAYVDAWERCDVEKVVAMLSEDVCFAMPPLASWFHGSQALRIFLTGSPMSGDWRWKAVATQANGQPALAFYTWNEDEGAYMPFALNVLTLRGDKKISDVVAFITTVSPSDASEDVLRMPEHAYNERQLEGTFKRFGMPERLL